MSSPDRIEQLIRFGTDTGMSVFFFPLAIYIIQLSFGVVGFSLLGLCKLQSTLEGDLFTCLLHAKRQAILDKRGLDSHESTLLIYIHERKWTQKVPAARWLHGQKTLIVQDSP